MKKSVCVGVGFFFNMEKRFGGDIFDPHIAYKSNTTYISCIWHFVVSEYVRKITSYVLNLAFSVSHKFHLVVVTAAVWVHSYCPHEDFRREN